MRSSNRFLFDFASKIDPRFFEKSLNSVRKIGSVGVHGILKITLLLDAILLPTWFHFGSQNPSESRLGDVLRRLGGVLAASWRSWECLGGVLRRLGDLWGRLRDNVWKNDAPELPKTRA